MESKEDTKQRILNTALEMIGTEGISGITVRKIASAAGVNIASVNYHFGSKENLITLSLSHFIEKMSVRFLVLQDESLDYDERFRLMLKGYLDTNREFPGVLKSIFVELVSGKNSFIMEIILPRIKKNFGILVSFMKGYTGSDDREYILMSILDKISSAAAAVILGDIFSKVLSVDLNDPAVLDRYIEIILDQEEA